MPSKLRQIRCLDSRNFACTTDNRFLPSSPPPTYLPLVDVKSTGGARREVRNNKKPAVICSGLTNPSRSLAAYFCQVRFLFRFDFSLLRRLCFDSFSRCFF